MLWADAICINQDDVQEKGHQVNMMGKIYTKAIGVIVWLGQDYEGHAKRAFGLVERLLTDMSHHILPNPEAVYNYNGIRPEDIEDWDAWASMGKISQNEWFFVFGFFKKLGWPQEGFCFAADLQLVGTRGSLP